jgi:hypothetical protein
MKSYPVFRKTPTCGCENIAFQALRDADEIVAKYEVSEWLLFFFKKSR